MGLSKWNKKADCENGITLSDVIRGLQFCVNSSAEMMEQHYLATMDKYIDPDTQAPLTKRFVIRDGYAITPLSGDGAAFSIDRGSFLVELGSAVPDENAIMDINLKFKSTPPPEALARIVEKLDNEVTPFEIKDASPVEKPKKD